MDTSSQLSTHPILAQAPKTGETDRDKAHLPAVPSQMPLVRVSGNNCPSDRPLGSRKTVVHSGNEQKGYTERFCETFFPSFHVWWRELRAEKNRPVPPHDLNIGEVFDLLGLDGSIRLDELDEEKLKKLLVKSLRKHHPDKNREDQEVANEKTVKINACKEFMFQAVRTGEFKSAKQRLEQGYI